MMNANMNNIVYLKDDKLFVDSKQLQPVLFVSIDQHEIVFQHKDYEYCTFLVEDHYLLHLNSCRLSLLFDCHSLSVFSISDNEDFIVEETAHGYVLTEFFYSSRSFSKQDITIQSLLDLLEHYGLSVQVRNN